MLQILIHNNFEVFESKKKNFFTFVSYIALSLIHIVGDMNVTLYIKSFAYI